MTCNRNTSFSSSENIKVFHPTKTVAEAAFLPFGPNWRKHENEKGGSWKTAKSQRNTSCLLCPPPPSLQAFHSAPVFVKTSGGPMNKRTRMSHTWLPPGCVPLTPSRRKSPDLCGETINTAGNLICAAAFCPVA